MAELRKNVNQKDQEIRNALKIRKALEARTQDLELRCQSIPLLEREKSRIAEKERHFADACKRLEQENMDLKEKIKSGQFAVKQAVSNPTVKKASTGPSKAALIF